VDITYIFEHSEVDSIIVDAEFAHLLADFRAAHPGVKIIIDTDTDETEGQLSGPFDEAVLEGLRYDIETGSKGWADLEHTTPDENSLLALAYTSGTTARPKGVMFTHKGAYLAALANVIESGLNYHGSQRARYLWTLP
jgi:long-subunit acyl-CoA synthetase (AMP-forming)